MQRKPEPELMDAPEEARAYAAARFPDVVESVVTRLFSQVNGVPMRMIDLGTGPGGIDMKFVL